MFGTVLENITGALGRGFLVASLFPTLLFVASNLLVITLRGGSGILFDKDSGKWLEGEHLGLLTLVVSLTLVAVAYLLSILSPVMRRLIEGEHERGFATRHLRRRQQAEFRRRGEAIADVRRRRGRVERLDFEWRVRLATIRERVGATPLAGIRRDTATFDELSARISVALREASPPTESTDSLGEAARAIEDAFRLAGDPGQLERARGAHSQWRALVREVKDGLERSNGRLLSDFESNYYVAAGARGVRSTKLGNVMNATWAYPYSRYGIDPSAWWPPLQSILPESHTRTVEGARIAYDFSTTLFFLSVGFTILWTAEAMCRLARTPGVPSGPEAATIAIGAAAAWLLYQACVESARSFASVYRASFDLYRHDLLGKLGRLVPESAKEEREVWEKLNLLMLYGETEEEFEPAQSHAEGG